MIKKALFTAGLLGMVLSYQSLTAHCQIPCGIYHDDMVFQQIDQYVETMYKATTILSESKFDTARDRAEFVRWVNEKEKASDEAAKIFTSYFLQQKIKPEEKDTAAKVLGIHELLFLMVRIKQNVDVDIVNEFAKKWSEVKKLLHVPGYQYKMEMIRLKKLIEEEDHSHDDHSHDDHSHDEDHPHTH